MSATLPRWRASLETSPGWTLLGLLPGISRPLTAVVAVCVVLSAALPTAFTLAVGILIGSLPTAIELGAGSGAGAEVVGALVAVGLIFAVQQTVAAVRAAAADALGRRVYGAVGQRIMRAVLRPTGSAHLEDPAFLDQVARAEARHWIGPRFATVSLIQLSVAQLQAMIGLLLVAHFRWWLALLLLAALLHSFKQSRAIVRGIVAVRMGTARTLRRADYFREMALRPEMAKEIRIFGLADWTVERFRRAWLAGTADLWRGRASLANVTILAAVPLIGVELIGLALVAQAGLEGAIGLGAILVYARSILASEGLASIGDDDSRVEYGASGLRPMLELERAVATDPRSSPRGNRSADGLPTGEIRFERVSFRYPGRDVDVFSHLDVTIPAGRSLAIVGDNGAGKTTLIKLLARLHGPTEGRIVVDGVDLGEFDPSSWQRRIAAIFQDFVRYPVSAADNVGFGAVERLGDTGLLRDAAERAGALDLVERLPRGWDTVLARELTGGVDLSGGEWQRIALARALFAVSAGASVLVLDEPTAHLDVRSEAQFYDRFFELTRGLTTIVISHRFSTVRRADRIVVLDQGHVAEFGAHDELMARGGRYAAMFGLQAARFIDQPTRKGGNGRTDG